MVRMSVSLWYLVEEIMLVSNAICQNPVCDFKKGCPGMDPTRNAIFGCRPRAARESFDRGKARRKNRN